MIGFQNAWKSNDSKMIGYQNDSKMIGFQNYRNGKTKNRDESYETQSEYYDSESKRSRRKILLQKYRLNFTFLSFMKNSGAKGSSTYSLSPIMNHLRK